MIDGNPAKFEPCTPPNTSTEHYRKRQPAYFDVVSTVEVI